MATVNITTGKFIAGIVIAILAASAISIGVSTQLMPGLQGPQGPQGEQGPAGSQGPAGADGATWLSGAGAPTSELGNDGDHYLDFTTNDIYKKALGAWVKETSIAAGADGATWLSGAGAPTSELGNDGDYYLDTDNNDVYNKSAGTWTVVANLKGDTGDTGIGFEPSGYISIPASAFITDYDNVGASIGQDIRNHGTDGITFHGPVQLPNGVTITNVTTYWYDADATVNIGCSLIRNYLSGGVLMASAGSFDSFGYGYKVTTDILFSTVDNGNYTYCFQLVIPANSFEDSLRFRFVTIGFEYPT